MEHTITEEFHKILEVQQSKKSSVCLTDALTPMAIRRGSGRRRQQEPEDIEELINKQKPLTLVLRLLCLMSQAQGGLKTKLFEHFQREIVQVRE